MGVVPTSDLPGSLYTCTRCGEEFSVAIAQEFEKFAERSGEPTALFLFHGGQQLTARGAPLTPEAATECGQAAMVQRLGKELSVIVALETGMAKVGGDTPMPARRSGCALVLVAAFAALSALLPVARA
jgi:hypothetical protein